MPHVTAHSLAPVHVVLQSPVHFTLHADESLQAIEPVSTWILQFELMLQATLAIAPSLKSHVESPLQLTLLASPPTPLQSEVSLHAIVSASLVLPSHFAPLVQASEQSLSPHSALQSVPAVHAHVVSAHTQPAPLQVGDELSLPHPNPATANPTMITTELMCIRVASHGTVSRCL